MDINFHVRYIGMENYVLGQLDNVCSLILNDLVTPSPENAFSPTKAFSMSVQTAAPTDLEDPSSVYTGLPSDVYTYLGIGSNNGVVTFGLDVTTLNSNGWDTSTISNFIQEYGQSAYNSLYYDNPSEGGADQWKSGGFANQYAEDPIDLNLVVSKGYYLSFTPAATPDYTEKIVVIGYQGNDPNAHESFTITTPTI